MPYSTYCFEIISRPSPSLQRYGDWNCQTCIKDVNRICDLWQEPETINKVVSDLSGEIFCQNPDLNLDSDGVAACQANLQAFMPSALPQIFERLQKSPQDACSNWYDIC